ncbi:hypothetical protein pb186bvf_011664 [Paramecium bursaria]
MVEHTREVQDLILTKHKILPSDFDFYSSQEYYENDQIKVEAQDENLEQDDNQIAYQREQSQKQLIYQLKQKQEFQDLAQVDPQLEVQINQIIPKLTFVAADKIKKQQNSRQERKLKRDEQKINQNEEENIKKQKYRKIVKDQQCLSCGRKFSKLVTLLKHEASDHGILRTKSLFDNGLQNKIHRKNEKSLQEQIQSDEIQNN